MVKVYLARAMSGREMKEVVQEATRDRNLFKLWGIFPLDPVETEGVRAKKKPLQASLKAMKQHWPRDKKMIREAHVFVDCTPHLKSQGVEREAGYARYSLWKPVVRIFPKGQKPPLANVAHFEDDLIVDDRLAACVEIQRRWGTRDKRFMWRIKMLNRCFVRWTINQIGEFK